MAAPSITLSNGQILLTSSSSILGLYAINTGSKVPIAFGFVAAVSASVDGIAVDDNVMFDPDKAQKVIYGSTIYYLVDQQYVSGNEGPPIP